VPCGFDKAGLPIGFQLVGRPYAEADILRVAHGYQGATEWHRRVPDAAELN
jgi:aspartyl-tRNA(Asn)/glutamyl-tRNA(Gln) amidotransferase subunit A